MVRGSRAVVINLIEQHLSGHLQTPIPEFTGKTIGYMLVHNANVYRHWLANFAMQLNQLYEDERGFTALKQIKDLYSTVDLLVDGFLNHYQHKLTVPVKGNTASGQAAEFNPLEIFTHAITHEFHHKGQILTMFRLMGHTPPDADVIRT